MQVLLWSPIDERHHVASDARRNPANGLPAPSGLVICRESDASFFLFQCDADWSPVADTRHESCDAARAQAELEFPEVATTWAGGVGTGGIGSSAPRPTNLRSMLVWAPPSNTPGTQAMGTAMQPCTFQWSLQSPSEVIAEVEHLRVRLADVAERSRALPIMASIELGRHVVWIGLGRAESLLLIQRQPDPDGWAREWVAVGSEEAEGEVDFWLHGEHHSGFDRRHLIPGSVAVAAAVCFLESLVLDPSLVWEENRF